VPSSLEEEDEDGKWFLLCFAIANAAAKMRTTNRNAPTAMPAIAPVLSALLLSSLVPPAELEFTGCCCCWGAWSSVWPECSPPCSAAEEPEPADEPAAAGPPPRERAGGSDEEVGAMLGTMLGAMLSAGFKLGRDAATGLLAVVGNKAPAPAPAPARTVTELGVD